MNKALMLHRACWLSLAILTAQSGCTHNYYYSGTPGCPPLGPTVTTQTGQVCEVPAGTVITSTAAPGTTNPVGSSTQVVTNANPQRIVISQPAPYSSTFSRRLPWHRSDPESVASSRYDGGLDDSSGNK